jgi:hypothetical protein
MSENKEKPEKTDYWTEIGSFIVLIILSALSHFWYIVIAISAAMVCCGAVVLFVQIARFAARQILEAPLQAADKQLKKQQFPESGVSTS